MPSNENVKSSSSGAPPKPPPKPAPKAGVDRIAELQAIRGEYNEVTVEDEGPVEDYAQYCSNLLSVCFTIVLSPLVLHVRHLAGRCDAFHHRQNCGRRPRTQGSAGSRRNETNTPQSWCVH